MASSLKSLPPNLRALDVSDLLDDRLSWRAYSHELAALAVNLVVAALILVVTIWAARWVARLIRAALTRAYRHAGEADATLQSFAVSLGRFVVILMGVMAALQQLGVQTTSVLAVLGAASIAIGLALQGALANVAAGAMILLFRPYRVGDLIETGGKTGVVKSLDLLVTELATLDNLKVTCPNGKVFGDVIVNYTHHDKRRVDVVFHIDPKRDLKAVLEGMTAFVADHPKAMKTPPPLFEAIALNELYAEAAARVWVKPADYSRMRTDLVLQAQVLSRPPAVSSQS